MSFILKVGPNECRLNRKEAENFTKKVEETLAKSMTDTKFQYFPADAALLAKKLTASLINDNNFIGMCASLQNEKQPTELLNDKLSASKRNRLSESVVAGDGFFKTNINASFSCPSETSWKNGLYYYSGSPSCKDVINVTKDYQMPAAMYLVSQSFDRAASILGNVDAIRKIRPGEVIDELSGDGKKIKAPIMCKGPKNETAVFNDPDVSVDIRFIIGLENFNGNNAFTSAWHLLQSCSVGNTVLKYRDQINTVKLLYNFGARVYLDFPVNINGTVENKTIVISYIASNVATDNSDWRRTLLNSARKSFFTEEQLKMYLLKYNYAKNNYAKK